jgi:hypothetical protein
MESGQVKTGENASDTYTKMLQEIIRITAPVAYGIAAKYPTVQKLVIAGSVPIRTVLSLIGGSDHRLAREFIRCSLVEMLRVWMFEWPCERKGV